MKKYNSVWGYWDTTFMRCLSIFFLCVFITVGCDSLLTTNQHGEGNDQHEETDPPEAPYPAILEVKTEQEQQALLEEYMDNNPRLCAAINEYGLNGSKFCLDREILRVEVSANDEDRMKEMAKEFLERNQEFTNVFAAEELEIDRSAGMRGCLECDGSEGDLVNIGWQLTYKNQTYKGLEVKNTSIRVFLDSEKVYKVYGHWYQNIVIPSDAILNYDEARQALVGKTLTYSDWTGTHTYVITKDSFSDYENKVIFPYETERGLEFRVCLVVSIGKMWHLYVDSTTGELIQVEQLIDF